MWTDQRKEKKLEAWGGGGRRRLKEVEVRKGGGKEETEDWKGGLSFEEKKQNKTERTRRQKIILGGEC